MRSCCHSALRMADVNRERSRVRAKCASIAQAVGVDVCPERRERFGLELIGPRLADGGDTAFGEVLGPRTRPTWSSTTEACPYYRATRATSSSTARTSKLSAPAAGPALGQVDGDPCLVAEPFAVPHQQAPVLGHSSVNLTMNVYSHVIPELGRDAADKMEAVFGT